MISTWNKFVIFKMPHRVSQLGLLLSLTLLSEKQGCFYCTSFLGLKRQDPCCAAIILPREIWIKLIFLLYPPRHQALHITSCLYSHDTLLKLLSSFPSHPCSSPSTLHLAADFVCLIFTPSDFRVVATIMSRHCEVVQFPSRRALKLPPCAFLAWYLISSVISFFQILAILLKLLYTGIRSSIVLLIAIVKNDNKNNNKELWNDLPYKCGMFESLNVCLNWA